MEKKVKTGKIMSLLKTLGVGESFYTTSSQKAVQAYATNFKIKVSTETILFVENYGSEQKTIRGTKVTILPKQ